MWTYIVTAGLAAVGVWFWLQGADFSLPQVADLAREGASPWQQGKFLETQIFLAGALIFLVKLAPWAGAVAGFFLPLFKEAAEEKKLWRAKAYAIVLLLSAAPLAVWAVAFFSEVEISTDWAVAWALGALGGWVALLLVGRFFTTGVELVTHRVTKKTSLERNKKTDVRDIQKFLPAGALEFNPNKYFDVKKGIFLGLDENKKPVFLPVAAGGSVPHVQVVGTTGAGKGVSLGVMAAQFLGRGEAVVFFDPKSDEWAPHLLHQECARLGVPFHFVDLRPGAGAQLNPLAGASAEEIHELFIAAFSLSERGDASDFYGIADRKAAQETARYIAQHGCTLAVAHAALGPDLMERAVKFEGKLAELAGLPSINARQGGVDLAHVVQQGGCVYVVGSMRHDTIKTVQRMLLVRLIQIAEARDRMAGAVRPVAIILDELKYHISRPALEALGAARDKGVHVVLAHQSLGDLRDCPADLDPDAVVDAVVENCRLKLVYKVINPATAEWLSRMSGTILVDDEIRKIDRNAALVERVDGDRSIRQADRFLIDENMLLNLPKSVSVLFGEGLPRFVSIQPIPTKKSRDAITPATVQGDAMASPSAKIDVAGQADSTTSPPPSAVASAKIEV